MRYVLLAVLAVMFLASMLVSLFVGIRLAGRLERAERNLERARAGLAERDELYVPVWINGVNRKEE